MKESLLSTIFPNLGFPMDYAQRGREPGAQALANLRSPIFMMMVLRSGETLASL
jgi:hypothetical protein